MTAKLPFLLSVTSVLLALGVGSEQERTAALQAPDISCVDPDRLYDHTVWTQQESVNHLFCPLDEQSLQLLQITSTFNVDWTKDCQPLNLSASGRLHSTLHNTTAYLSFEHPEAEDSGNYTCTLYLNEQRNASFTIHLVMADLCSVLPRFLYPSNNVTLEHALGSQIALNCTVQLPFSKNCDLALHWMKDDQLLDGDSTQWFNDNATEIFISSTLNVNVTTDESYGVFACLVRNHTAVFTLQKSEAAGHLGPVLAAFLILTLLLLMGVAYVKCRLNVLLWYRDRYGDLEINDGKLYDAYVSYASSTDDRKFVNFIMKPQLENRYGYKLFLDDKDILPNSEPSADLIMNVSRCRRLIVVLSNAYLEQEWCNSNFREGLWRLLELSQRPIFIAFESQHREIAHLAINLLKQHKGTVTLLTWRAGSMRTGTISPCIWGMQLLVSLIAAANQSLVDKEKWGDTENHTGLTSQEDFSANWGNTSSLMKRLFEIPSSDFWKELCLALPRKVSCRGLRGDPQTHLQEDKDPMLIIHSNYLDFRGESHPEGDAGVRGPIFKGPPPPRMTGSDGPPFGTLDEVQLGENQRNEIDISDLGSRNYGARTDFYCLVTEDDI